MLGGVRSHNVQFFTDMCIVRPAPYYCNETFLNYLPMGDKDTKRNKGTGASVFTLYSRGVAISRDAWAYNFSKEDLVENMEYTIAFYNSEVERYRLACEGEKDDERPDVKRFYQL